jgi:hypothetical protein
MKETQCAMPGWLESFQHTVVQAAKACCTPAGSPMHIPGFGAHERIKHIHRKPLHRPFRSAEEALFLSGVFSATASYCNAPVSDDVDLGGALRAMKLFAADKAVDRNHGDCTKHRAATGALIPGLMVCTSLGLCSFSRIRSLVACVHYMLFEYSNHCTRELSQRC